MFVQIGKALFNLCLLRPDAAVDETILKIREVHDASKVLSQPDRINDCESDPTGRRASEQAQDEVV